jgi:hypothetical protein
MVTDWRGKSMEPQNSGLGAAAFGIGMLLLMVIMMLSIMTWKEAILVLACCVAAILLFSLWIMVTLPDDGDGE